MTDERGYFYLPNHLKSELGLRKGSKKGIPFVVDANCVLLIRHGATVEDILKGLDLLKEKVKLRKE